MIQHLVFVNKKEVSCISFLQSFLSRSHQYYGHQVPQLLKCLHCSPLQKYLNIQLYNNHFFKPNLPSILQPSIDLPSNPIGEEAFKSHTHPTLQTRSQISDKFSMYQTLPHALLRKYHFPLLDSPICRFISPNTSYSLLNPPQSVHSYRAGTSFRLTYTAPSLCNLTPLQMACTTVSFSRNLQTTSIRATNSSNGD